MAIGIRPSIPLKCLKAVFLSATLFVTFLSYSPEFGSAETLQDCENLECLSGVFNESSCPEGTIYREKVAVKGCCPACVEFLTLDKPCVDQDYRDQTFLPLKNGVLVSQRCAPGLNCQTDETGTSTCRPDPGKCDSYQYLQKLWKPACELDGTFSPVQEKGDYLSGRRFCFNPDGKRIFGQSWRSDAVEMACDDCLKSVGYHETCSREATGAGIDRSDISLHCNQWGNYEHLQCDDGICWCSDTITGVPQSVAVPAQMTALLSCHLEGDVKSQYLHECDSAAVAAGIIKDILVKHGVKDTNLGVDRCDSDGSYGSFQIMKDQVHCTWKDKTSLSSYSSPANQMETVNCNCARDSKLFQLNDRSLYLICLGNGNYRSDQMSGNKSFCVDSDGYPTTDLLDKVDCSSSVQRKLIKL